MDKFAQSNNPVNGKTVVCGIIGDPIEHTISPIMHNAAFQTLNLDYIYVPFKVQQKHLLQAIRGMRAMNLRGLNVTIPHKRAVISTLDDIDPLAEVIGAVNTVVNTNGLLKGFNTDASGFIKMLSSETVIPEKKKIVVLGAGGAARAIVFVLADRGAEITIINRHLEPAQELANWIMKLLRKEIKALELTPGNLKTSLYKADILVNSTSVGMSPNSKDTLVPDILLSSEMTVIDIIYNPDRTRLLTEAANRGAKVISGLEMLVWQGAEAWELWTGQKAPVDTMRKAVIQALRKNEE